MRSSLLPIAALACAVVISACGSSGSSPSGGNGSSSGGGGNGGSSSGASSSGASSSGGSGGSGSSSGGLPADAAPVDGDVTAMDSGSGGAAYTVQFGPIQVPPGLDNTQCIVVNLHNPTTLKIGQIHDLLGNASHHMILYKVAPQAEQTTPFDCQPFQNTLNPSMGSPLVISQKKDDLLTLPTGVAFSLDPNQMVRLEMHFINANPKQTQTLITTSTLYPIDPATYKADAAFLFIGDINISIPPQATFSTGQQYFALPAQYNSSNFFAITGHEHRLGTNVQVWSAQGSSDPGVQIYQSQNWSDPPTTAFAPPLRLASGGGFKFQCDWDNTTNAQVSFGEKATDEMCFFWAYYWPSQGVSVCFNYGGLSLCCPQSGAAICSQL